MMPRLLIALLLFSTLAQAQILWEKEYPNEVPEFLDFKGTVQVGSDAFMLGFQASSFSDPSGIRLYRMDTSGVSVDTFDYANPNLGSIELQHLRTNAAGTPTMLAVGSHSDGTHLRASNYLYFDFQDAAIQLQASFPADSLQNDHQLEWVLPHPDGGHVWSFHSQSEPFATATLARTDAAGTESWRRDYTQLQTAHFREGIFTAEGHLLVAGRQGSDWYLISLDPTDGTTQWEVVVDFPSTLFRPSISTLELLPDGRSLAVLNEYDSTRLVVVSETGELSTEYGIANESSQEYFIDFARSEDSLTLVLLSRFPVGVSYFNFNPDLSLRSEQTFSYDFGSMGSLASASPHNPGWVRPAWVLPFLQRVVSFGQRWDASTNLYQRLTIFYHPESENIPPRILHRMPRFIPIEDVVIRDVVMDSNGELHLFTKEQDSTGLAWEVRRHLDGDGTLLQTDQLRERLHRRAPQYEVLPNGDFIAISYKNPPQTELVAYGSDGQRNWTQDLPWSRGGRITWKVINEGSHLLLRREQVFARINLKTGAIEEREAWNPLIIDSSYPNCFAFDPLLQDKTALVVHSEWEDDHWEVRIHAPSGAVQRKYEVPVIDPDYFAVQEKHNLIPLGEEHLLFLRVANRHGPVIAHQVIRLNADYEIAEIYPELFFRDSFDPEFDLAAYADFDPRRPRSAWFPLLGIDLTPEGNQLRTVNELPEFERVTRVATNRWAVARTRYHHNHRVAEVVMFDLPQPELSPETIHNPSPDVRPLLIFPNPFRIRFQIAGPIPIKYPIKYQIRSSVGTVYDHGEMLHGDKYPAFRLNPELPNGWYSITVEDATGQLFRGSFMKQR